MTLTEEQREAIRVISKLPMAIGCQLCHPYIMKNYGSHFIVLRAMIDSSGTVEPTGGFDLERARGLRDFLQDDCAEVGDVWGEMIAEIERLRGHEIAERDLSADLTKVAGERDELAARIKELETAYLKAQNSNLLRKQENERLLASLVEHEEHENQTHAILGAILGTDDTLENVAKRAMARIAELEK